MICCDICEVKISGGVPDNNVRIMFKYTNTLDRHTPNRLELCSSCAGQLERRVVDAVETMRARPDGRVGRG